LAIARWGRSKNAVIAYQFLPPTVYVHLNALGMNEGQFGKGHSVGPHIGTQVYH
jgi:hypothetical protein